MLAGRGVALAGALVAIVELADAGGDGDGDCDNGGGGGGAFFSGSGSEFAVAGTSAVAVDIFGSVAGAAGAAAAITVGGAKPREAARSGRGGGSAATATTLVSAPQIGLPCTRRQSRQSRWARSEIAWSVTVLWLNANEKPSAAKEAMVKAGGNTHPATPDASPISTTIRRGRMVALRLPGAQPLSMRPKP